MLRIGVKVRVNGEIKDIHLYKCRQKFQKTLFSLKHILLKEIFFLNLLFSTYLPKRGCGYFHSHALGKHINRIQGNT
jgi:hypothetical protein